MTAPRTGQVTDEYSGLPVPGASIYVYNQDGTAATVYSDVGLTSVLAQPLTTDQFGNYTYYAAVAYYREDTWYGGKLRYRENNIAIGSPGADLNLRSDLAANSGATLVKWLASWTGAIARTIADKLTDTPNAKDFGAKGDGTTDDTAALAAAIAAVDTLRIPAGTFIVSVLNIPAGKTIKTAGANTIIKRKAGIADGTPIINITGPNVRLGDIAVQGLIASETGEQNHGVLIQASATNGSLRNVALGNVTATDIRGDAVYIGSTNGALYPVEQVTIGNIYANNCWRDGLSVTDGVSGVEIASVIEGACGQHTIDLEPNGTGNVKGVRIGYVKGRHLSFAGNTTQSVECEIGAADLDLAYGSNSTPANPFDYKIGSQASGTHNAIVLRSAIIGIGRLKVNGYTGQAAIGVTPALFPSKLRIGSAEVTNCCSADTVYNSYFEYGQAEYRIGYLKATTTLARHYVLANLVNTHVGKAEIALVTGSSYFRTTTDCRTDELTLTVSGAGNGGVVSNGCTRCLIGGGTQVGDKFFSTSTRSIAQNVDATMATSYDTSTPANNKFYASRIGGNDYYMADVGAGVFWPAGGNIQPIVQLLASAATVTPTTSNDQVHITGQAVALTIANPTGTPASGQRLSIRIKDNGSAQTIAFGTAYRACGAALPTTTTAGKITRLMFEYNGTDAKWDLYLAVTQA